MKIKQGVSIFSYIFIAVSVIALIIMMFLYFRMLWIEDTMAPVESTIVYIDRTRENPVVVIEYLYDGLLYEGNSSIYSSSMSVGDRIMIYVNPNHPETIYQPDFFFYIIFPGIFAVAFGAIGFTGLIIGLRTSQMKKKYMTSGKRVVATITDIHMNHNNRLIVGSKVSYRSHIKCNFIDEFSGVEISFKSKGFWLPSGHGLQNGISTVHVYVDKTDNAKYFVDLESL